MLVRFDCAAVHKCLPSRCNAIRPAHGSSSPVTHPTGRGASLLPDLLGCIDSLQSICIGNRKLVKRQRAVPPNHRRIADRRHCGSDAGDRSLRPLARALRAKTAAVAGVATVLAGCGGSSQTATTVTSTLPATTKTVTVTFTPPPPPGPKTTIDTNGTFAVGSDIAPGTYRTPGKYGCYWARLRSFDTYDVIDNNVSDGPQVVQILPSDKAFTTQSCGDWHKVG